MKSKYLWLTDTHFDKIPAWKKLLFIRSLVKENPKRNISNWRYFQWKKYL